MINFAVLDNIDWDFSKALTNTSTNAFHPYPAKFIPQIPKYFVEQFSEPGDVIYEPFLGSGTTAVEANIMGRNVIGNDANELAVLISKVKTTPISLQHLNNLESLLNNIYNKIFLLYSGNKIEIKKPDIINLDLWFKDYVINELVLIKEEIEKLEDKTLRDFCLVAFSGIIINVSNQDSDTRYVRVHKNIKQFETYDRFARQLNKLKKIMIISYKQLENGYSNFKVADTRMDGIFPDNSANLTITSPPYPNAYDYHLYHKYRLFWLGMNQRELRQNEIGAHSDYSKKNGANENDFMKDMEKCFINIGRILKPGSYCVLLIGDSILKGRKIHNNEILKKSAKNTSLNFIVEYTRTLNPLKKSFNPKIGNIKTEKIMLFKNLK